MFFCLLDVDAVQVCSHRLPEHRAYLSLVSVALDARADYGFNFERSISIEIVKTIQAYFIFQDIEMYYEELDTACVPKTWNISDDLGQIAYIFSDKTGTLTRNVMEFQKCAVHGVRYGDGVTEVQRGALVRRGERGESPEEIEERLEQGKIEMLHTMRGAFTNHYLREDKVTLISRQLAQDLADTGSAQRENLIAFFRALALCHTVLSEKLDATGTVLEYKAESPDEAALVSGARDAGFAFVERVGGMMALEVLGQRELYTPLRVLEFTSARKRMSVLVREPSGRVALYCKGADSIIYARLTSTHDEGLKNATRSNLDSFANEGLRTLCVAWRYIDEQFYRDWERRYDAACAIVGDERDDEVEKISEEVECELEILGATALEDKLQEGVPEAIELLHRAGIKLWILTGVFTDFLCLLFLALTYLRRRQGSDSHRDCFQLQLAYTDNGCHDPSSRLPRCRPRPDTGWS